jgi:hypothetical protein
MMDKLRRMPSVHTILTYRHVHSSLGAGLLHLVRHELCRSKLIIDSKADESPVTKADREAEAAMRRLLAERVPEHAIFGAKPQHLRCCCAHMTPSGRTCLLRTEKIWPKQTVGES